jgi:hypothetical protein
MSIIDHISELRAEIAGCLMTAEERASLEAELYAALRTLNGEGERD